jgi:hypothetical protein
MVLSSEVRSLRGKALLASLLATAVVSSACTSTEEGEPTAPKAVPRLEFAPADAAKGVSPVEPVTVRASHGTIAEVSLTNPEGKEVGGKLSADKTSWESTEPLGYDREYTLAASLRGEDKKTIEEKSTFTTLRPEGTVYPSFFPPPGKPAVVGVGQPLVVVFDKPPADREAAERALKVTTTPKVEGGWFWWDDRTLHYRPKDYWPAGTKVAVDAKIYGVNLGEGMYGETDRTLNLTIGPEKIATIDDKTHRILVIVV